MTKLKAAVFAAIIAILMTPTAIASDLNPKQHCVNLKDHLVVQAWAALADGKVDPAYINEIKNNVVNSITVDAIADKFYIACMEYTWQQRDIGLLDKLKGRPLLTRLQKRFNLQGPAVENFQNMLKAK